MDKNNELIEIVAFSHDVSNSFKLNEELALNHAKLRELSINLENTVGGKIKCNHRKIK